MTSRDLLFLPRHSRRQEFQYSDVLNKCVIINKRSFESFMCLNSDVRRCTPEVPHDRRSLSFTGVSTSRPCFFSQFLVGLTELQEVFHRHSSYTDWYSFRQRLVQLSSEIGTASTRDWYSFHQRLVQLPSETGTASIRDWYSFHQRLVQVPSETGTASIRDWYSFHQRLVQFPSETGAASIRDWCSFHQRLVQFPSETSTASIRD